MALALYMDVHVPLPITEGLRKRGIDVLASQEDGTRRWADELLFHRATELNRVLFSQDRDLLRYAAYWQQLGRRFTGLVFGHQQRVTIGSCIQDLDLICQVYAPEELENQVIYLPL